MPKGLTLLPFAYREKLFGGKVLETVVIAMCKS